MTIPFLSTYIEDFKDCKAHVLMTGDIWSDWGKFFFAVGWWTTFFLKMVTFPLLLLLLLVFMIGNGANWCLAKLANMIMWPRARARKKHVIER